MSASRGGVARRRTRASPTCLGELRVVGGDGKRDRLLDPLAAEEAPAWQQGMGHRLAYSRRTAPSGSSMPTRALCSTATRRDRSSRQLRPSRRRTLARGRLGRRRSARLHAPRPAEADPRRLERVRPVPLSLVSYDQRMVLRSLIVAALLAAPAEHLGRSYEGRPIDVVHIAGTGTRILVIGCIHGDECEGIEVTTLLEHSSSNADSLARPPAQPGRLRAPQPDQRPRCRPQPRLPRGDCSARLGSLAS